MHVLEDPLELRVSSSAHLPREDSAARLAEDVQAFRLRAGRRERLGLPAWDGCVDRHEGLCERNAIRWRLLPEVARQDEQASAAREKHGQAKQRHFKLRLVDTELRTVV